MAGDHRDFAAILSRRGFAGIHKIGEGSFGVAVLVEDKDGKKGVCKLVDVSRASTKDVRDAKREGRLLARLKYPYIVRYVDSFADRGWLGILMEFANGGDLTDAIQKASKGRTTLDEDLVQRWFSQAMLALKYLHGEHVLHRDLKPSNLFLTIEGDHPPDMRMGDFGVSKTLTCTAELAHTLIGTPYYLSPEVVREKPYSWPSDIWSMGCILYQMCALRVPFEARDMRGLVDKITKTRAPEVPEYYSTSIRTLATQMMNRSSGGRPTAEQIVESPMVQGLVVKLRAEGRRVVKDEVEKKKDESEAPGDTRYEVMDRFRMFDANGDGIIDRDEFASMLRHLDAEVWTDERIDHMLHLADTNGDGKIQFDEFVHWIFGNDKGVSLAGRATQMIELAHKAAEHGDLVLLGRSLLRWRQAIDIGYLRVSPPEVATKACESLAWIALGAGGLLESAEDVTAAFNAAKQMSAILHHVEQLLVECSQPAVRRIGAVASRAVVRGLCLELADGTRFGECPHGLNDDQLNAAGVRWQNLKDGEHIVEVKGVGAAPTCAPKAKARGAGRRPSPPPGGARGRSPSPAPVASEARPSSASEEYLTRGLIFCTNLRRELPYGKGAMGEGVPFSFKADAGTEVVEVLFNSRSCVGVRTAPTSLDWSREKVAEVFSGFRLAAESVCTTLLVLSWKVGPQQGRYAQLQARRMGVKAKDLYVPDEVKEAQRGIAMEWGPPSHWDCPARGPLPPHPAATFSAESSLSPRYPVIGASLSELRARDLLALQDLLAATHVRRNPRPSKVKVPNGMTIVHAARLQSPEAWANFVARREAIRTQLREFRTASGIKSGAYGLDDLMTDAHLKGLDHHCASQAASLLGFQIEDPLAEGGDAEVRCSWLFHGLSPEAAKGVLQPDFAIDRTGAEDGRLYGHGVYFTECCSRADMLTLGNATEDDLRCLLLCRCVLGNMLTDEEVLPDVVHLVGQCVGGSYHSIVGDRRKRSPDAFREFVVYDADQVYPEILIWYRRKYQ